MDEDIKLVDTETRARRAWLLSSFIVLVYIDSLLSSPQVNNKDIRQATHQEAVMALIAPTFEIILEVRHDPMPNGLQVSHPIGAAFLHSVSASHKCVVHVLYKSSEPIGFQNILDCIVFSQESHFGIKIQKNVHVSIF